MEQSHALITNDAVVLGLLLAILALVFKTSTSFHPRLMKFYSIVPMLLLCYFLPSLLNTFNIVDGEHSQLYFVASRFLLPACLILLTLSVDLKEIARLGYKPVVMFLTGTTGVILGGPLAILMVSVFNPALVGGAGPEAVWRGMSTVAGSWIGGGANQAAMYEVFSPSNTLFGIMITVDIIVAEVWMAFLLIGIGKKEQIDRFFKADSSSVAHLQKEMEAYGKSIARNPTTTDLMVMLGIAFAATGLAHLLADNFAPYIQEHAPQLARFSLTSKFFWLIVMATSFGVLLSFTRARTYEGAGASKIGTVFIFILVATIGMKMDIRSLGDHPGLFLVGGIWMLIHIVLLVAVGKMIRAPYFFLAIGSK
ncbi:MAG: DUF819 family protein, partial [Arenicella sp.]|nr:DUF819 family protein [Arenicella sp.]